MNQFVEYFAEVLAHNGDIFFSSGDKDQDERMIKETIKAQGFWAGVRVRYYFDNNFKLSHTEDRTFGL